MGWNRGNARKGLRQIAGLIFVLQAVATGLAPIAHAHAEALNSERKIEAAHSSQCVPVHSETRCTLTTLSPQERSSGRVLAPNAVSRRIATPGTLACTTGTPINPACNGERAPPSL